MQPSVLLRLSTPASIRSQFLPPATRHSSRLFRTTSPQQLHQLQYFARLSSSTRPPSPSPLKSLSVKAQGFHTSAVNMAEREGVHNVATKKEFDSIIAEDDKVVVIDFFATWCGPCKVVAPKVVEFSKKYPNAKFLKVDVDEVPDVAQELGIRAMPTFVLYKKKEKVKTVVGANPKALEAAIEEAYKD